jgi:hypothetical protein
MIGWFNGRVEEALSMDVPFLLNASLEALANTLGLGVQRFKRLIRISTHAPSIVESIPDGTQPQVLTVARLNTITNMPLAWDVQRALFGAA